jgi:apolipoprotein N-acyltransferase
LAGWATPRSGATPYVRFGDAPALVFCLSLLIGAAALERRR